MADELYIIQQVNSRKTCIQATDIVSRSKVFGNLDVMCEPVLREGVGWPFTVVGLLSDLDPRGATVGLPA